MIYMDNAATSMQKPPEVVEAVTRALCSVGNSGRGVHDAALDASRIVYNTRVELAKLFGTENPNCIAFTMNSTESLNIALRGTLNPGDHVITTVLEHNSVLRPLYELEEQGVELTIISCDELGNPQYADFETSIRPNTKAIVCTHASNLTGNLVNIQYIGEIARKYNLLFIVDASQSAGVFPIDVQKQNIDILCFTGHKSLLGPQGTGGLYVRQGIKVRPLLSGGSGVQTYLKKHPSEMPTALEAGTLNTHGLAGLYAAVKYIQSTGIDKIRHQEQSLMWTFYNGIRSIPGVQIYGDFSDPQKDRSPIVTLNIHDYDSSKVSDILYTDYNIATRPGAHCAPLMHQSLGTVSQGAVRFSFSHYNTLEEVEIAIRAIQELVYSNLNI